MLLGSLPGGLRQVTEINAFGSCPVQIHHHGSTTVGPITQASEAPFDAQWAPNTSMEITLNGSGNGITDLTNGVADIAASSRPLTAGENTGKYVWQIGKDSFVIGVQNDGNMAFLTNNDRTAGPSSGLTVFNLTQIWNAQGAITNLHWDELSGAGPSWPHRLIVPRARITGSGSRPDFDKAIAVPDANEAVTISTLGLPRLTESSDMADAASTNDDQIVYTSLGQISTHPNMLVVAVEGIVPDDTNVGSYALPRQLFITTRDKATVPRTDNTEQIRADDYVNYIRSSAGDALIAAEGFPTIPAASVPPVPDHDPDLSGAVTLGDLGAVAGRWGRTASGDTGSNCPGWIRPDVNNDGKVSLGDIGKVESHWGQDGLICDAAHDCTHPGGPQ